MSANDRCASPALQGRIDLGRKHRSAPHAAWPIDLANESLLSRDAPELKHEGQSIACETDCRPVRLRKKFASASCTRGLTEDAINSGLLFRG